MTQPAILKAAIFDMDGVLVVNMHVHKQAFYEFGKRHGVEITEEFFNHKIFGNTNQKIMPLIFGELSESEIERFSSEKEAIYREIYEPHIEPIKGLIAFLEELKIKRIKMAIASNAPAENVDFLVNALELGKYFQVQLNVTSVENPKPAPDMFLKAARLLGVHPVECVVFEDSPSGIKAAIQAGMKAVALLTSHSLDDFSNISGSIFDFESLNFASI